MPETEFNPWVGKFPWRKKWQPTLVFLPGESHGLRNLAGYSPWGHRELDMTERLTFSVQWAPQPFVEWRQSCSTVAGPAGSQERTACVASTGPLGPPGLRPIRSPSSCSGQEEQRTRGHTCSVGPSALPVHPEGQPKKHTHRRKGKESSDERQGRAGQESRSRNRRDEQAAQRYPEARMLWFWDEVVRELALSVSLCLCLCLSHTLHVKCGKGELDKMSAQMWVGSGADWQAGTAKKKPCQPVSPANMSLESLISLGKWKEQKARLLLGGGLWTGGSTW